MAAPTRERTPGLLAYLMRVSRRDLVLAVIAGVISGAASTGLLALINSALAAGGPAPWIAGGFVALCLVVPLSRVAAELLLARLGQNTVLRLRLDLSRNILALPLRRLEQLGPHRLLSTLTDDIPILTGVIGLIPTLCINASIIAGGLVYLGYLSWQVLLAVLVVMAIGIATYQLPVLKATVHLRAARTHGDELQGHFRALTDGAKELKMHSRRRSRFLDEDLETAARAYRDRTVSGMRIFTIANSWGQLLVFVVIGFLLFALPRLATVDATTLTGYALTLIYMMTPLQTMMSAVPPLGRARVSMARLERTGLQLAAEVASSDVGGVRRLAAGDGWRTVDLVGVTHAYRREGGDQEFRLGPIDLTLHRGELLFVAGGNGSGKTTLAKLIAGLYQPMEGEIRLDGEPIDAGNRQSYREMFAAVFSDFFLFPRLVGLGAGDLDGRAGEYLRELQLQDKVRVEDGELSTLDLSQGQRKRLALLTAWLEDRPIYLFDEWAADQDPVFKEIFYRELLPRLKARGKSAVVITHDDRYYDLSDRTIKLENGQLVGEIVAVPAVEPIDRESPLAEAGG